MLVRFTVRNKEGKNVEDDDTEKDNVGNGRWF